MDNKTKKCKHCQSDIPVKAKVCPTCKKKQSSTMKTVGIVLAVLVVIGIIGSAGSDDTETNQTAKASQTETVKEVKAESEKVEEPVVIEYEKVTAKEMLDLLESNALKAEKTYQDKYVEVTGKLSGIDSDGDYISIKSVEDLYSFINIQCYIQNEEQLDKVIEMTIDDTITVKGQITSVGEVLGYSLHIDSIE